MTTANRIEFGDFQTPLALARAISSFLVDSGEVPESIVEPTCGRGSFIVAAAESFPRATAVHGFDINLKHIQEADEAVSHRPGPKIRLSCADFFRVDWNAFLKTLSGRILILGNPPWVTNATLGAMNGKNLPAKSNFQGNNGFAAKTGKANFDISEWMLIKLADALHQRAGCIAMLCKTSVARKTLRHAWVNRLNIGRCSLHLINAKQHFGASVDACLLIFHTGIVEPGRSASVYPDLSFNGRMSTLGLAGRELVADVDEYLRLRDIDGIAYYTWRSGVKHDAAAVMEFLLDGGQYVNGTQERCHLERTYLFPLLKSSDIANGRTIPERHLLVTQKKPSEDTIAIKSTAPKTWAYLNSHADLLNRRRSIIYQKRPRFSIFGVGDYTFSPWKVAVSGFYKNCRFEVVGTHHGKPIVLDDTCYFIPCQSEKEACFVCDLLNSDVCQRFLRAIVFFDAKRPITIGILNRIDLKRLAEHVGRIDEARHFLSGSWHESVGG